MNKLNLFTIRLLPEFVKMILLNVILSYNDLEK